ncbi:guanylate kinase [Pollutibacter soli]|uniref:guanylate kinase n=1 Tax=Pollutibacter soli TaxID=3034157 RepID=UPI003013745A
MSTFQNKIIIITAPSGAGKTSITRYLLETIPDKLAFSVSATTRAARAYEKNGVDYFFLSPESFRQNIQENAFVEWEMVYEGKYYGTLRSELQKTWDQGKIPLLDIDVKGAIHVKQQFPETSLSLFIEPPSVAVLRERLLSRGTETTESLEARVNKASYELSFKDQFDAIILNDELSKACREALKHISSFIKQ